MIGILRHAAMRCVNAGYRDGAEMDQMNLLLHKRLRITRPDKEQKEAYLYTPVFGNDRCYSPYGTVAHTNTPHETLIAAPCAVCLYRRL